MTINVDIEALGNAKEYFEQFPEIASKAASMAINQVVQRGGLKLIRDEMLSEIAFPKDYLNGDRLRIGSYATPQKLEATINARKRATSVARFGAGGVIGRAGVTVRVSTGSSKYLKKAWLVKLNKGASLTEDSYNVGLAVRLKKGETVSGKRTAHQSWFIRPEDDPRGGGVALLYGPSVDQVFRQVSTTVGKPIADMVATEFFRQLDRLL